MPLDDNDQKQIEKYMARMAPALAELRKWQAAVNAVHEAAGEPPPYDLAAEGAPAPGAGRRKYGRAEFYAYPLATVVKRLIEDNGALSVDELYELMLSGGFPFKESNAEKAKDNMKISLGKNIAFGKTSNGYYTLSAGRPRATKITVGEPAPKATDGGQSAPGETPRPPSGPLPF